MKPAELIVPAVVVVGGAYALSKIVPNLVPDPIKWISDWWTSLFQKQTGLWTFARDTMHRTEGNAISAAGLLPSTPVLYGWKEIGFQMEMMTTETGDLNFPFTIAETTPNGVYTVYLDQRPWNGGYGERKLTVIE